VSESWQQMLDYLGSDAAWSGRNGLPALTWAHLKVSIVAVLLSAGVAVPAGVVLGHVKRGALAAVTVVNIGRAIPSFAILALLLPFSLRYGFGLGFWPTFVALVVLALPPIFTNTYAGIVGVDPAVVDAARGMGMRGGEVLWRVEAPNALPLLLTGLRVSAVQVVATATLGAFVGFGGLGAFINEGYRQLDDGKLLTGAVLVAILAIITELLFGVVQRWLTPWITRKAN
jgi:osmoprotectant transport system permease protein